MVARLAAIAASASGASETRGVMTGDGDDVRRGQVTAGQGDRAAGIRGEKAAPRGRAGVRGRVGMPRGSSGAAGPSVAASR